jgi:hypothetical protein
MTKEPDNRELAQQVELLKKDYEIMKTDLQATLETIRAENARRELRMILTVVGLLIAATSILGFVLTTLN